MEDNTNRDEWLAWLGLVSDSYRKEMERQMGIDPDKTVCVLKPVENKS